MRYAEQMTLHQRVARSRACKDTTRLCTILHTPARPHATAVDCVDTVREPAPERAGTAPVIAPYPHRKRKTSVSWEGGSMCAICVPREIWSGSGGSIASSVFSAAAVIEGICLHLLQFLFTPLLPL